MDEQAAGGELAEAQRMLGVRFRDVRLLQQALTHRSLLKDARDVGAANERLEFLGDSVLGQAVAEYLYRKYPTWSEGRLTKVKAAAVSQVALGQAARQLLLGELLHMARGEEQSGGRSRLSILSDSLEAVIGAIFLDRGMHAARRFVLRVLAERLARIEAQQEGEDYKTLLQEQTQERHKTVPSYRVIEASGPEHSKTFVMEVILGDQVLGMGCGRTKKAAEQAAARQALERGEPEA